MNSNLELVLTSLVNAPFNKPTGFAKFGQIVSILARLFHEWHNSQQNPK
jgi:hypothetical protein